MKLSQEAHGVKFTFECDDDKKPDKETVVHELNDQLPNWLLTTSPVNAVGYTATMESGAGFTAKMEVATGCRATTSQYARLFRAWCNSVQDKL